MGADRQVLGIDVGGTKVAVGAVDGVEITELEESPTESGDAAALLDGIEATARRVIDRVGRPPAVGVGVPSQIEYATGTVESSVNIPLAGVPLREELGRRFGVPVFVDNDANCAALAEAHLVDDGPARVLVMLTLGTGVGGGVVLDGETFRGAHGLGAELGHFTLDPEGPPCPGNCPNRGCVEAYCSGQALERDATEFAADMPGSHLAAVLAAEGRVTGRALAELAREGDADALRLFERFSRMLGVAIAGYVNVFEPEYVVIGGGLSQASDLYLEHAVDQASSRALPALWRRVTVSLARGGATAGVIGAGVLAAQEAAARDTAPVRIESIEGAE
ncbi:MAG TPA: ROK family protein [Thermoleophilaceae bacterium]|nr:ROK family protein [Thermoleophilaceae bacterium]